MELGSLWSQNRFIETKFWFGNYMSWFLGAISKHAPKFQKGWFGPYKIQFVIWLIILFYLSPSISLILTQCLSTLTSWSHTWRTPKLHDGFNCESKGENKGRKRSSGVLPGSQHFGGRRACWSSRMGLGWTISSSIIHKYLYKPNNKLVSA
jgi:hypothetical protein